LTDLIQKKQSAFCISYQEMLLTVNPALDKYATSLPQQSSDNT
jgi:hypothetical protein